MPPAMSTVSLTDEQRRYLDHLRVQRRLAERTLTLYTEALQRLTGFASAQGLDLLRLSAHQARRGLAQLHAATAQVGIAEAAFYPSIKLTGSFGYSSEDLGSLISAPARLYNIGPSLSLPIFEGGQLRWPEVFAHHRHQAHGGEERGGHREEGGAAAQDALGLAEGGFHGVVRHASDDEDRHR